MERLRILVESLIFPLLVAILTELYKDYKDSKDKDQNKKE